MKLHLDIFEGPLDLLLYLIKKDNLEISRVSISRIAEQYLEYLDTMRDLNIDMASEFLLMAAELAQMKSRALLPSQKEDGEPEDEAAEDLIARLRAYQHYKQLAEKLGARRMLGRDVFKRGSFSIGEEIAPVEEQEDAEEPKDEIFDVSAYELVKAFNDMIKRIPKARRDHRVIVERVSVTERIYEIVDVLDKADSVLFTDLFKGHVEKIEFIVTFMAILEMGKLHLVRIFQSGSYGPIRLQKAVNDARVATSSEPMESGTVSS